MTKNSPERKVQTACKHKLDYWQAQGVVIHYDDLSDAGRKCIRGNWIMQTKKGRPDLIAYFKHQGICWVYLIEVKAPDGGNWSKDQQVYASKFSNLSNVIYEVVRDSSQIHLTIERITNHEQNKLDRITL